jgi:hypothetical protein
MIGCGLLIVPFMRQALGRQHDWLTEAQSAQARRGSVESRPRGGDHGGFAGQGPVVGRDRWRGRLSSARRCCARLCRA